MRSTDDGRGVVTLLELPGVQDRPVLFSTFLMWLLAELFEVLPVAGDVDKPKLVFFFDEAHLLFKDASCDFTDALIQTVRLIRSKGVGVFFVTQTPKDDLEELLTNVGIGEAVVTVMSEKGAPTPVAYTMLPAPQSLMAPSSPEVLSAIVAASPLATQYSEAVDRESAYERLTGKIAEGPGEPLAPAPSAAAPLPDAGITDEQRLEAEI